MARKNLLHGLDVPPPLPRGKPRKEEVEPWIKLTEELIGRGVRTPTQLRKLLNVSHRSAERWIKEVRRRWTRGLTDDRVNWRRETLYSEADAVARAAWIESMGEEVTPSQKASLFKIVLLANQRKASLTGLDLLEVKIKKETHTTTIVDVVARVETEHGLAPGALGAIGRQAAKALSGERLDLPALQLPEKAKSVADCPTIPAHTGEGEVKNMVVVPAPSVADSNTEQGDLFGASVADSNTDEGQGGGGV